MSFLKETEIEKDTTESIEDCEKKKEKKHCKFICVVLMKKFGLKICLK